MTAAGITPNHTLLQKADLQVAGLSAGGILVPEQAAKFLAILIRRSMLMQLCTVETMANPEKEINKIRFAGRVLQPAQSGVALGVNERSSPNLSRVTLQSKLFKAEIRLNDEVLEDNIERGTLKTTVMQEFGKAISRDMEDVIVNGDLSSSNLFYATMDGIIAQASSNTVVAGGVSLNKDVLRDTLKALPIEFMFNKLDMRYLTSVNAEIDYRDSLSNRMTAEGDRALGSNANTEAMVGYTGIPVMSVPVFPENLGVGTDETVVLFTNPENIHVGIQRKITLKTDEDITSGEWIAVMTLRFDVKYAEETAVAIATGVTVS